MVLSVNLPRRKQVSDYKFSKQAKPDLKQQNFMAQIEYYKLEQRDVLTPEQTRSVYRLKHKALISGEQFVKEVAHRRGYSEATIMGVFIDAAKELAEQLGSGYSVELPGIGIFSIGVRMKKDEVEDKNSAAAEASSVNASTGEGPTKNARSLRLDHINFRKNKDFFREVNGYFRGQDIRRVYGKEGVRIKTSQYPQVKNRMIVAREFLATHPFMTIQDYADITGLSYSAAQRELKKAWLDAKNGIAIMGRGSHRVYVLR